MADTIRDRAALLALLGDNVTQDINPQDYRDVLVSVHGAVGAISLKKGSTAQGSISTTPVKVTGFDTNGPGVGITPDHSNDRLTVPVAGLYLVFFQISFNGTAATEYDFILRQNQVETDYGDRREIGTAIQVGSASFFGPVDLAASAQLEVYVEANGASKSITPSYLQLMAKLVG